MVGSISHLSCWSVSSFIFRHIQIAMFGYISHDIPIKSHYTVYRIASLSLIKSKFNPIKTHEIPLNPHCWCLNQVPLSIILVLSVFAHPQVQTDRLRAEAAGLASACPGRRLRPLRGPRHAGADRRGRGRLAGPSAPGAALRAADGPAQQRGAGNLWGTGDLDIGNGVEWKL